MTWKLHKMKIKFYWNTIMLIHMYCLCFHATVTELSTCNLNTWQQKSHKIVERQVQNCKSIGKRSTDRSSEGYLPKQRQLFHGEKKVELMLQSLVRWQSSGFQSPGELVNMKIPRTPYTEITSQ